MVIPTHLTLLCSENLVGKVSLLDLRLLLGNVLT